MAFAPPAGIVAGVLYESAWTIGAIITGIAAVIIGAPGKAQQPEQPGQPLEVQPGYEQYAKVLGPVVVIGGVAYLLSQAGRGGKRKK